MIYAVEVTNRPKGLDLVDRLPEELQMEVHNIVQEAVTKTIPKKKKCVCVCVCVCVSGVGAGQGGGRGGDMVPRWQRNRKGRPISLPQIYPKII